MTTATRKQAAAERREERRRAKERLADLRRQLREARTRRRQALLDARERCRADRLAARERARALRLRVLEELRGTTRTERATAREICAARLRDARSIGQDIVRTRAELAAQRQLARDLRAAARSDRERRLSAPPSTCHGCRAETDDDVLANIPSDLAPLYDRVKRSIKAPARGSRTEAFLKYAESHPDEVLAATGDRAHFAVLELEAQEQDAARRLSAFETRKAEHIERLQARAARRERAAHSAHASAQSIADRIPMGQPILVGHHSERRHRRDLERIDRGFRKALALTDEAEALRRRAERAETSTAVSSDDPEAVTKLRAKLDELERDRARMVAANKAVRSRTPQDGLRALGFSDAAIEKILKPDPMGNVGFPGYALRNRASESARLRKRIADLEARATRPAPAAVAVAGARIEETDNRVRITFDAKPDEPTRTALKRAGFRWSPTIGAWQRHASTAAWYEAKRILNVDDASTLVAPAPPAMSSPAPTAAGRDDERLDTAEIAQRIRADIKAAVRAGELPKAKYSVRTDKYSMGSSITVVVSKLPFPTINPDAFIVERGANWATFNRAHFRSRFTERAQEVERKLNAIVDAYHWDRSDSMTDYYDERFARDVRITEDAGAWKQLEAAKVAEARAAEEGRV